MNDSILCGINVSISFVSSKIKDVSFLWNSGLLIREIYYHTANLQGGIPVWQVIKGNKD